MKKIIELKPNGYDEATFGEALQTIMEGYSPSYDYAEVVANPEDAMMQAHEQGFLDGIAWSATQIGVEPWELAQGK